jgi:hypothetical protein
MKILTLPGICIFQRYFQTGLFADEPGSDNWFALGLN